MGTEMGKRQGSNKQQNRKRAPTKQVKARQPRTQMEMLRMVTTDHQRRKTTQSGFPWDSAPWSVTNKCYGVRMRRFRRAGLVNSLTNWLNNTEGVGVGGWLDDHPDRRMLNPIARGRWRGAIAGQLILQIQPVATAFTNRGQSVGNDRLHLRWEITLQTAWLFCYAPIWFEGFKQPQPSLSAK